MRKKIIYGFVISALIIIIWFLLNGLKQVQFSEMCSEPKLNLEEQKLIIHTENSCKNSAFLIFYINSNVNIEKKEILLTGYQAIGTPYLTKFNIDLSEINLNEITKYRFYWIDSDGKRNLLSLD
jgi:hypothetical protein